RTRISSVSVGSAGAAPDEVPHWYLTCRCFRLSMVYRTGPYVMRQCTYWEMVVVFVHDTSTVNKVVPVGFATSVGDAPPPSAVARCAYCQCRSGDTSPPVTAK